MGVYSDDRVIIGPCDGPCASDPVRQAAPQRVHRGRRAHETTGVNGEPEKSVLDQPSAVVWGGQLSSERLDVGGEIKNVKQLSVITTNVILVGAASIVLMRRLIGCRVRHLMFRRAAMCIVDELYAWLRMPRGGLRGLAKTPECGV